MRDLLSLIRWMLLGRFRSKASLEAEILALRHQLNVLRRTSPRRAVLSNFDRMIFVCLYRIAPPTLALLEAMRGQGGFTKRGVVRISDIEGYVNERVKGLTKGGQKPLVAKPKLIENLPIIRVGQ